MPDTEQPYRPKTIKSGSTTDQLQKAPKQPENKVKLTKDKFDKICKQVKSTSDYPWINRDTFV